MLMSSDLYCDCFLFLTTKLCGKYSRIVYFCKRCQIMCFCGDYETRINMFMQFIFHTKQHKVHILISEKQ